MAPIDATRRHLPAEVRRVVYFSMLLLFLTFLRLVLAPRPQQFPSGLITTRPTNPKPLMITFSPDVQNGLGAQVLHMLDAAALAHFAGANARICIRESRYWNYGCAPMKGWSCYFATPPCQQFRECPEFSHLPPSHVWSYDCVHVSSRASANRIATVARLLAREHPVSQIAFFRHVANSLWRFNSHTAGEISSKVTSMQLPPASYVAVHIRRGDKRKEVRLVPLYKYIRAIRLIARPKERIFVATDDGSVVRVLRKELSEHEIIALPSTSGRSGHLQSRQNRLWMKVRYESVVDLLTEIEIMRRARVFVATFSSNLARLVHVLRNADERDSISLDDRWAPGVAWRTFGQSYCAWPGSNETFCDQWRSAK